MVLGPEKPHSGQSVNEKKEKPPVITGGVR